MFSKVSYTYNYYPYSEVKDRELMSLFSQFPAYLEEIGDLLENYGIESAFVEGNIFRKNKALQSFKAANSKVKVILLSLEKAASGTNLVEASHVILMGMYPT